MSESRTPREPNPCGQFSSLFTVTLAAALALAALPARAQQPYDPAAVSQKSLDVRSALTVMSVALQPGFEDVSAIASLRTERGARIAGVYITNGESGSSDAGLQIPGEIAFSRRAEAYEAMRRADGFEMFANMPDFGSASDTAQVRLFWHPDTLQTHLAEFIRNVRPDLVLLSADPESPGAPSPRWSVLRDDLMAAVRLAALERRGAGVAPAWEVSAVLADDGDGRGLAFRRPPSGAGRPSRHDALSASIGGAYASLQTQLPAWEKALTRRYDVLKGPQGQKARIADDVVPDGAPPRLAWIASEVRKLNQSLQKKTGGGTTASASLRYEGKWLLAVMDSVDITISRQGTLSNRERKTLLQWKEGLEDLRNTIFGVSVAYRFQDSVLLARQVTTLKIQGVNGVPPGGTTELFFPDVGRRWTAGERTEQRQTLETGKNYVLISPQTVELDLPASYGGRDRISYGSAFPFFVFHTGQARSENFFKKIIHRHLYAPKLSVEPLTPIVRVVPGERLIVRLTNNSHDGLRDLFGIRDSLASSRLDTIRLNGKGVVLHDTLGITWAQSIEEGDYRLPLEIGGHEVAYFVARKFEAALEPGLRIAVLPSFINSPVLETLRRFGLPLRVLSGSWSLEDLGDIDVLLLDERVMSLHPEAASEKETVERFAAAGGRVVILAQDPGSWNSKPLLPGVKLTETTVLDAVTPVRWDSTLAVAQRPNPIAPEDWEGWLFARSKAVAETGDPSVEVLARDARFGHPLVLRKALSSGTILFVNLSLSTQLMNVHPGATRLFANLLSAR